MTKKQLEFINCLKNGYQVVPAITTTGCVKGNVFKSFSNKTVASLVKRGIVVQDGFNFKLNENYGKI